MSTIILDVNDKPLGRSFEDFLDEYLADKTNARCYLEEIAKADDEQLLAMAIQDVQRAKDLSTNKTV
jgi:DNA-binding phage protein